jgi:hypothetical protein
MRLLVLFCLAACLQTGVPAQAPKAQVAESVFQVRVLTLDGEIRGTAWIVRTSPEVTTLVTAGHVCAHTGLMTVVSRGGGSHLVTPSKIDPDKDLCVLEALDYLGPALPLAPAMPDYAARVFYIGGAAGIWGDGMAPVHEGLYAGGRLVSIPTAPGASGAPMVGPEGVFGVLVSVSRGYPDAVFIAPLSDLQSFLR